jgi:murein DD-endopeptidase MepM/ murein hydrolase activator NlpD
MKFRKLSWAVLALVIPTLVLACSSPADPILSSPQTSPSGSGTGTPTPVVTRGSDQNPTLDYPHPSPTGTDLPNTHIQEVIEITSTPCPPDLCVYPGSMIFARPIALPGNDQVDISYRFGSTQGKKRDPHHGVELLNRIGTPVLAAADGVVVVAGDDKKVLYSPYYNFYGNLVVIQHNPALDETGSIPDFPTPIYTLYAHLSEIMVKPGEKVRAGQEIGRVGMTGGATGGHLHFEVRLGENTYAASHNPELWLLPHPDKNGQQMGALVGQVFDSLGRPIQVKNIVVEHLTNGSGSSSDWEIYLGSYEEKTLLGRPPWEESFAAGDLPAGWYRITFPYNGLQRREVQILPGQITVVKYQF